MNPAPPKITIRIGCHIVYETAQPTPFLLVCRPWRNEKQWVRQEKFSISPGAGAYEFEDTHGNIVCRTSLQPGQNIVHHDALVEVSSAPDEHHQPEPHPVDLLPASVLRYTLPSRYCDSDKLLDFAWREFGPIPNGVERVTAICDWVHQNISYRFGSGRPDTSASEVIAQRFGVCRDFAHAGIALCRAFNLPARYVVGHLPDIGFPDHSGRMDFHAYFEVYLGHAWHTFDARFNTPRIGRIKVAQGLDAVDGAFSTSYGEARLAWFEVWAYQVNPDQVSINDPIDLSKRLDNTTVVRLN